MKVMLTSRNQITIPKQLIDQLNLKNGEYYDLILRDGELVLKLESIKEINTTESKEINTTESKDIVNKSNIKIVSNLEEGANFSRKIYSECGLVIRTKRPYMEKFCEACQGQLSLEYGVLNHPCKYNNIPERVEILEEEKDNISLKPEPKIEPKPESKPESKPKTYDTYNEPNNIVKNIISKLSENVNVLNNKIDDKINKITDKEKNTTNVNKKDERIEQKIEIINDRKFTPYKPKIIDQEYPNRSSNTYIKAVIFQEGLRPCYNCGELQNRGFIIDGDFYCRRCTKNDFMHYLKKGGKE